MSSEQGSGERFSKEGTTGRTSPPFLGTTSPEQSGEQHKSQSKPKPKTETNSPQQQQQKQQSEAQHPRESAISHSKRKPVPQSSPVIAASTKDIDPHAPTLSSEGQDEEPPRQVIAVSASKGPAAFFNLARKFLATDEMCDLSALEGAIVSAVDAAHLLERSQLASIVR